MKQLRLGRKGFTQPPFWTLETTPFSVGPSARERIEHDFEGYVQEAYKASGVVFACQLARHLVFTEARFLWRREYDSGQYGKLFGTPELRVLRRPWANGTTGDLLARMEQDSSIAGNSYLTTVDDQGRYGRSASGESKRVTRLRPDWVTIVLGSRSGDITAPDTKIIAFSYQSPRMREPVILLPEEVAHYAPIPDPTAAFRGMSWITPVVREVMADKAATRHKLKFFENGATLSNVVTLDKDVTPEDFKFFVDKFREQHEGVDTAYKTLFMGGGADVTTTGADMHQLDFKITQGAGETRIANAARVPAVIVGLSEGLAGSSLNAGNYSSARRSFADGTMRPLWRMAAGALERLVTPPDDNTRLWFDTSDIAFLREDAKDLASIQLTQAQAVRQFTDAGFTPESVVAAVQTNDWSRLQHSGLFSVQLQPPGPKQPAATEGEGDAQGTDQRADQVG